MSVFSDFHMCYDSGGCDIVKNRQILQGFVREIWSRNPLTFPKKKSIIVKIPEYLRCACCGKDGLQ